MHFPILKSSISIRPRRDAPLRTVAMRGVLMACALLMLASAAVAQTNGGRERPMRERDLGRRQAFGFGGGINFGLYSGDIDEKELFPKAELVWRAGAEATMIYRLGWIDDVCTFHLRVTEGYHPLRAGSETYSFVNYASATSLSGQVEFFITSPLRVYVFGGLGYMKFRLHTVMSDPLFLEKNHAIAGASNGASVYPIGIGIVWYAGRNTDVYYQFTKMLTSSDNLDGWISRDRDNFQVLSIGFLFYL